jgi:hypothetical protein
MFFKSNKIESNRHISLIISSIQSIIDQKFDQMINNITHQEIESVNTLI